MTDKKEELKDKICKFLSKIPVEFFGPGPLDKSCRLAELIFEESITYAVEIGVFKGRSFFPQAIAMTYTGGVVMGIDPYTKESAYENDVDENLKGKIDEFINSWNPDATYETIKSIIKENNFPCSIVRERAEEAVVPNNIELLHIDGNHDTEYVTKDIQRYLPKVKKGGYVVMDDTHWNSVKACLNLLENDCELIEDHAIWQIWKKIT